MEPFCVCERQLATGPCQRRVLSRYRWPGAPPPYTSPPRSRAVPPAGLGNLLAIRCIHMEVGNAAFDSMGQFHRVPITRSGS
jgi:hypothetical protein